MDLAWVRREVKRIYIRKAAQTGVSEGLRCVLMHMALSEPDPVLLVLPDEKTGKRVMNKRILPLFEDTPCLRKLRTDQDRDQQLTQILLANGFNLQLGWTGSPATMASDPARVVAWDETDKGKQYDGKEAGTSELIDVRTATYENSLFIALSTPTTPDGPISTLSEGASVHLAYYCPCRHCGHFQILAFERVRYPHKGRPKPAEFAKVPDEAWAEMSGDAEKKRRASLIEQHRAGWYECERCAGVILDHHKQRMLLAGYWGTADGGWKLWYDGHEEGVWPGGSDVSMPYPAQQSLAAKHKFFSMAAEWIRCEGDSQRTQGFYNSWLGEPFAIQTKKTEASLIERKREGAPPPLVVPKWAKLLIATADVQGNDPSTGYFYYLIRAWGYEYQSQLIDYGVVNTFEELRERCLDRETNLIQIEGGGVVNPHMLLIDAGNRANEIYQFALSDPARIKPTKGSNTKLSWPVEKKHQQATGVILWRIDTDQTKDLLNRLMHSTDENLWRVHSGVNPDYCQQLASEQKVYDRRKKQEIWKPKTEHTPNHLFDCEQMQCAAAWDAGCGKPEPEEAAAVHAPQRITSRVPDWIPTNTR